MNVTIVADHELSQQETNAVLLKLFHTDHWHKLEAGFTERIRNRRWESVVVEGTVEGDPLSPDSARLKAIDPPRL